MILLSLLLAAGQVTPVQPIVKGTGLPPAVVTEEAGVMVPINAMFAALAARDGQAMGELAEGVLVDSPTLTKIIDRMVTNALVYRAPEPRDRRKVLIFLSTKGRTLHSRLVGLVEAPESDLVGRLDGKEAETLASLLAQLMHSA